MTNQDTAALAPDTPATPTLQVIPLGGMGEIGKNIFAFRYGDEIMVVDGGLAFPKAHQMGIDLIVPRARALVTLTQAAADRIHAGDTRPDTSGIRSTGSRVRDSPRNVAAGRSILLGRWQCRRTNAWH